MYSIVDLLTQDSVESQLVANTNGGEYAGPCPMCGGEDRFRAWPNEGDNGRWWCRGCGQSGDCIEYLTRCRNMSYRDAFKFMGVDLGETRRARRPYQISKEWIPREMGTPNGMWQKKALEFVYWSRAQLHDAHVDTRHWLFLQRGLKWATIVNALLGWNPEDSFFDRESWGLPQKIKENGTPAKLWLPRGLVIPCFSDNGIERLRVRRPEPNAAPRYIFIPGGSSAPMVLGNSEYCVVVESELDGLLLHQEAGDLVTAIAIGNAQTRPDRKATDILQAAKKILVSLDDDEAGAKNAWEWWLTNFPNAVRLPPVDGKDPTEMHLSHVDLKSWIEIGINEL